MVKYDIEKLLREGRSVRFYPQGYSMHPLIVNGRDMATVSPLSGEKGLKRGDVVLYRRFSSTGEKGILVLHRIHHIDDRGAYMVGDNQTEIEGPVSRDHILGIMTSVVRRGREIDVNNPVYRLLTGLWLTARPIRPLGWKITATYRKIFGRKR